MLKTTLKAGEVRLAVRELGISLNKLGKAAGFSRGYIYRLLEGGENPETKTLDALVNALADLYVEGGTARSPTELWRKIVVPEIV